MRRGRRGEKREREEREKDRVLLRQQGKMVDEVSNKLSIYRSAYEWTRETYARMADQTFYVKIFGQENFSLGNPWSSGVFKATRGSRSDCRENDGLLG